MKNLACVALVLVSLSSAYAQTGSRGVEDKIGPGVTSSITPRPGPATEPALPAAATPPQVTANRDQARAAKAAKKAQKAQRKTQQADKAAP